MSAHPLTQQHRAQQILISQDTVRKVERLWPALDFTALDASYPRLAKSVAAVVTANRLTSAATAARYIRAFRRDVGLNGLAPVVMPSKVPPGQFATSLLVTSVVSVKSAVAAGDAAEVAMSNALTRTSGAMSRLVLDGGRETVRRTTVAEGTGWVRVGFGECSWCEQYLDGEVHYVEGYDFQAHDSCRCTAEPAYSN